MAQVKEFLVDQREDKVRLDLFLAQKNPGITRSQIKRYIEQGLVTVQGLPARTAHRLRPGEKVCLEVPPSPPQEAIAQPLPLDILYEDDWLIVVNKAAGMTVHPAPGHFQGTLANALLHHCRELSRLGGALRPGIVHRLDKDTSGVLVIAKKDEAYEILARQFKAHSVTRIYYAVVLGGLKTEGVIEKPLGRHVKDRKKFSARARKVRPAITRFRVLERLGPCSLLEIRPFTGRTHQIRVHLKEIGHPVVGDKLYGRLKGKACLPAPVRDFPRQALHAYLLGFVHPGSGQYMEFSVPLAEDIQGLIARLKGASG